MLITVTLLLGFLVFIHEGGHYLAARACGVRVSEFMIGLAWPLALAFARGEHALRHHCRSAGRLCERFAAWAPPTPQSPSESGARLHAYRTGHRRIWKTLPTHLSLTDQEAYRFARRAVSTGVRLKRPTPQGRAQCVPHTMPKQWRVARRRTASRLFPAILRIFLPRRRRNNTARCHSGSAVPSCSQVHS